MEDGGISLASAGTRTCECVCGRLIVFVFASPHAAKSNVIAQILNVHVSVCVCFHFSEIDSDASQRSGNVVLTGITLQQPTG